MDLGALEVQIFVSLTLVLGAVFVALLCDFLKGNNEWLRERNIELAVRQQERERLKRESQPASAPPAAPPVRHRHNAASPGCTPLVAPPAAPPAAGAGAAGEAPAQGVSWATEEEQETVEEMAERIRSRANRHAPRDEEEEEEEPDPGENSGPAALASGRGPAAGTGSGYPEQDAAPPSSAPGSAETDSSNERLPLSIHAKVTPIDVVAAERAAGSEALRLASELEHVAGMAAAGVEDAAEQEHPIETESPEAEAEEPVADVDPKLESAQSEPPSESAEAEAPVESAAMENLPTAPSPSEDREETGVPAASLDAGAEPADVDESKAGARIPAPDLPAGFHPYCELSRAAGASKPFHGTIVSIGVKLPDQDSAGGVNPDALAEVTELIQSLLEADDFACRSPEDEFLLIIPRQRGASVQRRLQRISERLWDYQIRSVGTQAVMFTWGAAEISGEPLDEAVASARERMRQTQRTRLKASSEIHHYQRRAAND